MPKVFGREMPTWIIGSVSLLTAYLVYDQLFPSADAAKTTTAKKPVAKKATQDDPFDRPEDHRAKFAIFTEPVKNSFKPLIGKGALTRLGNNSGIDPSWADGEANWGYSGYVVVNGTSEALIENSGTGEGTYVHQGDVWKHNVVRRITSNDIVFDGESGSHTVILGQSSELKDKNAVGPSGGVAPVNPLQGAIGTAPGLGGGQIAGALPGQATDAAAAPAEAVSVQPFRGRGRRGRRGQGQVQDDGG